MSILPRLPTYIGREDQKNLLRAYTRQILEQPCCRALYFQAGGGLGKTHLLLHYPQIVDNIGQDIRRLRIANLVDFYSFETRNPTVIEERLIDGLKQTDQREWYRLPAPQVDESFTDYSAALQEYRRTREIGTQAEITRARERLRQQFVLSWNSLTPRYALVMSFDTLETLFSEPAPPEALVNAARGMSSIDLVLEWMQTTLPRLQHTLVLLSGRPVDDNRIITALKDSKILVDDVQQLDFLTDRAVIKTYIETYTPGQTLAADEIERIERITEGRPLLLTCYAETRRSEVAIPPPLPGFKVQDSRPEFEDWLIETILNPLLRSLPSNSNEAQTTLAYALYFLVYARRGLRREALIDLFAQLNLSYDRRVLDQLDEVALVKRIDDKLFLHDEIFVMIDQSGKPDECGLRESTLDYLCRISREQVQHVDRHALLGAMADNMYYELSRDFVQGYRTYVIYADLLLDERSINDALILSDAFWSTLNYHVSRGQERIYPYRNALAQSTLTRPQILEDEQVNQVQLLLAQDQNQAAIAKAEQLYQTCVQAGALPPDDQDPKDWPWRSPQHDPYLFVSLNLWRAYALHLAQRSIGSPQAERLLSRIITFLEQLDRIPIADEFLKRRQLYFLSQAYVRRGYIYRQQQYYTQAQADYDRARMVARSYQESGILPADRLSFKSNLAHITNNLAYVLALTGNLKRALTFSNEVIREYLPAVSTYQRALYWNTNALIRMKRGELVEAEVPLRYAEQAAQESEIQRARALVAQARGLLKSAIMNARQEVDEQIEQHFEYAVQLAENEPDTRREIYQDWAAYARVIAVLYGRKGDHTKRDHYQHVALRLFDQALDLIPDLYSMQFADLIIGKATVYSDMQNYAQAQTLIHQAEDIMRVREAMPEYAQVICGKIALQSALIMLDQQRNVLEALKLMTLAMARAFVFARLHLDQGDFERLIDERLSQMPGDHLRPFYTHIQHNQLIVTVDDLPYQKPDPGKWADAWAASVAFMCENIETRLDF